MRIALHDTLLERQLVDWLAAALRRRGHEVLTTRAVHHEQRPPAEGPERDRVDRAALALLAFEPDGVVAFRPFSLPVDALERLGRAGAQRMLFLGDDPVHYALSTRDALAHYDVMLHAGHEPVLRFYERHHGPTGVTMPFWAEPAALPRSWALARTDVDLVFLGSVSGQVRSSRADVIDNLGVAVRIHGNAGPGPTRRAGQWLDTSAQVAAALALGRAALNIPQVFSSYAGSPYDFPELAGLGHFWIPSRTVQYAAVGVPIVTVAPATCPQTFPGAAFVEDGPLAGADVRDLLSDAGALASLASRAHEAFRAAYTADARAELIEWLVAEPGAWRGLTVEERAHRFEQVGGASTGAARPHSAGHASRASQPAAAGLRRVVVSGYFGKSNTGDDVLLDSLCAGLRRHAVNPVEVIVTAEPPSTCSDRLERTFPRNDLARGELELRRSSALVVGPGGLLHDHGFARAGGIAGLLTGSRASVSGLARLPLLASLLGRDVHLFGVGAGPLDDPDARAVMARLADCSTSICVRDDASRDLLRSIAGLTTPVSTAPDIAYAWELPDAEPPARLCELGAGWPILAVNVRSWPRARDLGLYERLAAAISEVSRLHELAIVGVAMQGGPHGDAPALRTLVDALDTPHPTLLLDWEPDPAVTVAVLRQVRGVVAMRLHACLLGHRCGRPVVGLAYEPKVTSHFARLGSANRALGLDAGHDELVEAIAPLGVPGSTLATDVAAAVRREELAAQAALARLAARVDAAPPSPAVAATAAARSAARS